VIRKERPIGVRESRSDGAKHAGKAKSIVRNFLPRVSSAAAAAALFILSMVHLTPKCADDSPLFPLHFALVLLLRAFPLSRLFGNLFFYPCGREELPCFLSPLIIVIHSCRPFSSSDTTGF